MRRRPRIGFDARLAGVTTGIGRWTDGLLGGLEREAAAREIVVFGAPGRDLPPAWTRVPAVRTRFLLWQHLILPGLLARHGVDAFCSPLNLVTCANRSVAQVAFCHDLIPLAPAAETGLPPWHAWKFALNARTARSFARAVVCVSRATAGRVVRELGLPARRLRVVHPGVDRRFRPPDPTEVARVRRAHGLEGPYLLAVGGTEPRKGGDVLVRALERLPVGIEVVVAGPAWAHRDAVRLPPAVRRVGRVPDEDLPALYGGAAVFCYPSRMEGFGLPPLEAMACGTPVVASAAGAIPEATGGAARLVPPDDPEALAGAVREVLGDDGLRADLVGRGRVRAGELTWERAAREVLAVLDEAAGYRSSSAEGRVASSGGTTRT